LSFRAPFKQKEQIFAESCVDFEVAHLSILMVWRLPKWRFLPQVKSSETAGIFIYSEKNNCTPMLLL